MAARPPGGMPACPGGADPSGGTRTTTDPHTFGPTAASSTSGGDSGAAVKLTVSTPGPDRIGEVTAPLLARTCTSGVPTGMVTRALRAPAGIDAGVTERARSQERGAARAAETSPRTRTSPNTSQPGRPLHGHRCGAGRIGGAGHRQAGEAVGRARPSREGQGARPGRPVGPGEGSGGPRRQGGDGGRQGTGGYGHCRAPCDHRYGRDHSRGRGVRGIRHRQGDRDRLAHADRGRGRGDDRREGCLRRSLHGERGRQLAGGPERPLDAERIRSRR